MHYPNGGFGVLLQKNTSQVFVWKDRSYQTVKEDSTFKVVSDFDSNLAAHSLSTESVFQYTDPHGITWIVSVYPFFRPGQTNDPSSSNNQLVILVFAQRSLAENDLDSLNSNINSTTNQIVIVTIIIIACTVALTILLVFLVIEYITRPLESMRSISEDIAEMQAEDEDKKDYRAVLRKAYVNLSRTDEVGLLASEYYYIVGILHNKNTAKKEAPKYPKNPFNIGPLGSVNYDDLTWAQFVAAFDRIQGVQIQQTVPIAVVDNQPSDLDVLGSLGAKQKVAYAPVATSEERVATKRISPEQRRDESNYVAIATEEKSVGWFTSLKSQLYALSAVLHVGVTFTMLFTVISLSRQGSTWMSTSTTEIDNTQIVNMQAITDAKSVYVEVLVSFCFSK